MARVSPLRQCHVTGYGLLPFCNILHGYGVSLEIAGPARYLTLISQRSETGADGDFYTMSDNPTGTEAFNMSMRKFLKQVGVTSQQEIENAIRKAHDAGQLAGKDAVSAKVTLTIDGLDMVHTVDGTIKLS